VEKGIKEMKDKKATGVMMYLRIYSKYWEKMVSV